MIISDIDERSSNTDMRAKKDFLNMRSYANGLAEYIMTCETPMTVALQGGWGTGKSTLFSFIEERFDEANLERADNRIGCVRLEAWPFSALGLDAGLLFALMDELAAAIDNAQPKPAGHDGAAEPSRLRDKFHQFAGLIGWGMAGYLESKTGNGTAAEFFRETFQSLFCAGTSSGANAKDKDIAPYKRLVEFSQALEKALASSRYERLVVFVDDLDRIDPIQAVTLLEQMKNFMECKGCVFVLAIDDEVVFDGIVAKYGEELGNERKRLFFDKIIQIPFEMPVERYDIDGYVKSLAGCKDARQASRFASSIHELFNPNRAGGVQEKNPRAIKRYMNIYNMYRSLFDARADLGEGEQGGHQEPFLTNGEAQDCLFALAIFMENYPDEYAALVRASEQGGDLHKRLEKLEKERSRQSDDNNGFTKLSKWLKSHDSETFEAVIQQVLIGEAVSLTRCVNKWKELDDYWDGKTTQALNEAMEGKLIKRSKNEGRKEWVVLDDGRDLGLIQSFWISKDGAKNRYVVYSRAAQQPGSQFQRKLRSLLEDNR